MWFIVRSLKTGSPGEPSYSVHLGHVFSDEAERWLIQTHSYQTHQVGMPQCTVGGKHRQSIRLTETTLLRGSKMLVSGALAVRLLPAFRVIVIL